MMVQKLTTHMGKTGLIGSDNYKFKQQQPADKTWKKAKKWYRDTLAKLKSINDEAGLQTAFTANNVMLKTVVEEQAEADISRKLGESFDTLAMAATTKSEIHDSQAGAIATLAATNATLVTTNATLTAKMKKLTAEVVQLKAQAGSNGAGTMQGTGAVQQARNLASVVCPVEKGKGDRKGLTNRLYFVEKQHCVTCGFEVRHLSAHCPQTKEGKKRKAEVLAKKAAEAAEACKGE